MLGALYKYLFFIASFSPLWALMSIRYVINNPNQQYVYVVICIMVVIVLSSILLTGKKFSNLRNSTNSKKITVSESREIIPGHTPYIIPYLFSIPVAIDGYDTRFVIIAAMALVGILYVKTRMILTSPAIMLAGFRIFEIKSKDYARPIKVIAKKCPLRGHAIRVRDMDHDLCIEQKDQT